MNDTIIQLEAVRDPEQVLPSELDAEQLWERYSSRFELPIAVIAASLILSILGCLVYIAIVISAVDPPKLPPAFEVFDNGEEDTGHGPSSPGLAEPSDKPIETIPAYSAEDIKRLPQRTPIPEVKAEIEKEFKFDNPNMAPAFKENDLAAMASLDASLRKALNPPQTNGTTNSTPSANPGGTNPGANPMGSGADSSRARTMRWTMLYKTDTGADYLNQLAAMGAIILVPLPPDNSKAYIFRDLRNPRPGQFVTEEEVKELSAMVRFSDIKRTSVMEVSASLGMRDVPDLFYAFFPKTLENDLALKEVNYRGVSPDKILETKFQVVVQSGVADIRVVSQKVR